VALDVAIDVVVDVGSKASNELGVGLEGEALPPDPQPNLCEQEANKPTAKKQQATKKTNRK
jgi:hypothetical protein